MSHSCTNDVQIEPAHLDTRSDHLPQRLSNTVVVSTLAETRCC